MNFIEEAEPIVTQDLWYDLFEGGYVKFEDILEDQEDIDSIYAAMSIIQRFVDISQQEGFLEIC